MKQLLSSKLLKIILNILKYYLILEYKWEQKLDWLHLQNHLYLSTSAVCPDWNSPPKTEVLRPVVISHKMHVWSPELVIKWVSSSGTYWQHETYPLCPLSILDTGRFPSLSVGELRLKIEQTLSRPPQATDWPVGEKAQVITHAQGSLIKWVFWLVKAFHTINRPSWDALTIRFFSGVQSNEYTYNFFN